MEDTLEAAMERLNRSVERMIQLRAEHITLKTVEDAIDAAFDDFDVRSELEGIHSMTESSSSLSCDDNNSVNFVDKQEVNIGKEISAYKVFDEMSDRILIGIETQFSDISLCRTILNNNSVGFVEKNEVSSEIEISVHKVFDEIPERIRDEIATEIIVSISDKTVVNDEDDDRELKKITNVNVDSVSSKLDFWQWHCKNKMEDFNQDDCVNVSSHEMLNLRVFNENVCYFWGQKSHKEGVLGTQLAIGSFGWKPGWIVVNRTKDKELDVSSTRGSGLLSCVSMFDGSFEWKPSWIIFVRNGLIGCDESVRNGIGGDVFEGLLWNDDDNKELVLSNLSSLVQSLINVEFYVDANNKERNNISSEWNDYMEMMDFYGVVYEKWDDVVVTLKIVNELESVKDENKVGEKINHEKFEPNPRSPKLSGVVMYNPEIRKLLLGKGVAAELSDTITSKQHRAYKLESQEGMLLCNWTPKKGIEFLINVSMIACLLEEINGLKVMKVSERLSKVLCEAETHSLAEKLQLKNGSNVAERVVKQLEKSKCEVEKERVRMVEGLMLERLHHEKVRRCLQNELEKKDKWADLILYHSIKSGDEVTSLKKKKSKLQVDNRKGYTAGTVNVYNFEGVEAVFIKAAEENTIENNSGNNVLYMAYEYTETDVKKFIKSCCQMGDNILPQIVNILMFRVGKGVAFTHEQRAAVNNVDKATQWKSDQLEVDSASNIETFPKGSVFDHREIEVVEPQFAVFMMKGKLMCCERSDGAYLLKRHFAFFIKRAEPDGNLDAFNLHSPGLPNKKGI